MSAVETLSSPHRTRTMPGVRSDWFVRLPFCFLGTLLAAVQIFGFRYFLTADAIAYMDMSDGMLPGHSWHHLITGVWSPLYPALLGAARRLAHPTPGNESLFDHALGLPIFLFAFACFDKLLLTVVDRLSDRDPGAGLPLPRPALLALGYGIFLWASLTLISLQSLRPDILMSGFLYLSVALALRIRDPRPSWWAHILLGAILGVGFLAKAPMLPIGFLIIAGSVVVRNDWCRRIPMALASVAALLLIGALYFVPLSLQLHRFTLGESSRFNYLAHVDQASTDWYGGDMRTGFGVPLHRTRRIFDSPPAYSFSIPVATTDPLRFDPSYWTQGLKPKFQFDLQFRALRENLHIYLDLLPKLYILIIGIFLLFLVSSKASIREVGAQFMLWVVGLAGILMYALVHVEDRYVGTFFVLLLLGCFAGLRFTVRRTKTAVALSLLILACIVGTLALQARRDYHHPHGRNIDAAVAAVLPTYGILPGDPVARISPFPDLGWARVSRVTIIAEVNWQNGAREYWTDSPAVQQGVLHALAGTGAKAVVGRLADPSATPPSGWQRIGNTEYWIYPFASQEQDRDPNARR